ncbi:MAG: helix-turn-helix transcriptional regulator [Deltaproteobacteria bacterium]|nr:helix-turn-helix transcriptional regulator [Deltaproteobacteria bacterium]
MLEHMKKLHTNATLVFHGPAEKQEEAVKLLESLGFTRADSDSIPWNQAFEEFADNKAGTCLAGARHKEGLTQVKLSGLTGIPQRHISEMERGKRPIGKKNAKLFSKVLNIDYRMFL